jgi:hypothetical protein
VVGPFRSLTIPCDIYIVAPAAMLCASMILVNRPIVATPKRGKLCRTSEAVLDLLDRHPTSFTNEDGEIVRL